MAPARRGGSWKQAVGIPLNVFAFLVLMVLAWGSLAGFLAHPARAGMVVVLVAMTPAMTLATGGRSRGVRHVPDRWWFLPLLAAHTLFTACAMPYMDARELLVLPGGDALRWSGLALLAAGAALRVGAMLELGRRFVSVVALQEDHRLHTSGIYARVRHPSYLGILVMDLGFAGVFRSAIALALLPVVAWMFKRRMDLEEEFLLEHFGDPYRDYVLRTWRLVPGLY